ncbi:N-acetyltransferase [Hydrogenoanaerobacterium sp.]|uniref:GNAT family N-acetyltransferase n=1 Tax=Hydrogenoanaerobacterium sp. TaxID=2953763 RepID=UPI002898886C|nr:N-acetyltransferase [Hydrogenoanaerobacterium sp.]
MDVKIRQEKDSDMDEVYHVVKAAFENAPHTDHDEHNLVNRLRKSSAFIAELSLVAEYEREIVGYILFTKIKIGTSILLALAPVAVLPAVQSKGIGGQLIRKGHEIACALGYNGCIVLGHAEYYPKFGYKNASFFHIKAPFEVPDDNFMAVEFKKDGLANIQGSVEYAKEFFEA